MKDKDSGVWESGTWEKVEWDFYHQIARKGSSYQGFINARYEDLVAVFGEPRECYDGKVQVELVPTGAPIEPRSLLTKEGVYWIFSSMLRNFTTTPALGLIFVAMLGIGLAEKFGLFSALMRALTRLSSASAAAHSALAWPSISCRAVPDVGTP